MKKVLVFLILGILLINLIGIVIADNNTKLVERPVEKSINTIQDDNKTELEDDSDDEDDETEEIETLDGQLAIWWSPGMPMKKMENFILCSGKVVPCKINY